MNLKDNSLKPTNRSIHRTMSEEEYEDYLNNVEEVLMQTNEELNF